MVSGNLTVMLFDIRVVDIDAPSYCCHTPPDVLQSAELDKKKKYLQACQDRRAAFPLFVFLLMDYREKSRFFHTSFM